MPVEHPPEITRIHQLMAPWVASTPDAPAVRDAHLALTYAQLDAAARSAQAHLVHLGLRPGDRLLVVGENCVALCMLVLVLVLAASRMEVWSVVANARLSDREIDLFVDHAQPRRVLYTPHVSPEAARHASRHGASSQPRPGLGDLPVGALNTTTVPEPCFADPRAQVGCVLYTSGTPGAPKGKLLKGVMKTMAQQPASAESAGNAPAP